MGPMVMEEGSALDQFIYSKRMSAAYISIMNELISGIWRLDLYRRSKL